MQSAGANAVRNPVTKTAFKNQSITKIGRKRLWDVKIVGEGGLSNHQANEGTGGQKGDRQGPPQEKR